MKTILTVDPIRPVLTGIGRYTWELASRIPHDSRISECRFFSRGSWVADCRDLLKGSLADRFGVANGSLSSRILRGLYRYISPGIQSMALRKCGDSLFHSTNFYLPPFKGKTVVTVHDLSALKYPQYHPVERIAHLKKEIPRVIARADHLITDSEFTRQEVLEYFGLDQSQVSAVHLGATDDYQPRVAQEVQAVLAPLGLAYGRFSLCVATIEPRKNIDGLVDAYRRLPPDIRQAWPLVLAGHTGWNSTSIHQNIQRGVTEGWLVYLGYVAEADLPLLFSAAAAFVFPSWYEGFGLPVLQAMASGVPCVVSNASSLPEVAQQSALVVDPADLDGLAKAIERALTDQSWRDQSVRLGLQGAARMTWDKCAVQTVDAYEKVIEKA